MSVSLGRARSTGSSRLRRKIDQHRRRGSLASQFFRERSLQRRGDGGPFRQHIKVRQDDAVSRREAARNESHAVQDAGDEDRLLRHFAVSFDEDAPVGDRIARDGQHALQHRSFDTRVDKRAGQ